jgi:DNA polymerase III delta prime subunit
LLPIGSELEETKLDAIVEVKEGDSWEEFKSLQTILVKDGIVIEIR